ncbi:MAG: hypothetical protein A2958_00440 [Candidatus Levybacteria bacterium RIFCSPLOWO2_01_FULL_38_13]|nr:MAG: hypothetical protein A2629_02460 [Candidatus Levybacteria bacterium RIFCSPHIGHO2_01_FULL_41_15]OGH34759.1 MAG: hypothetical protein A2958_00440 [Candidatus Levybacteria bacterium RIFCSPLOWO2_01_FULL_38_13]
MEAITGRRGVPDLREGDSHRKHIIIFVGPEGSGKSSQAKLLADQIGLPFLTYGDVFRRAAEEDDTCIGDECRRAFREHDYIKLPVLKELISREIKKEECQGGVVIDGALRIPGEVETFEELLQLAGIENPIIFVFYLRIPGWKSFERLVDGRRRQDDTIDAVQSRLFNFYSDLGKRMADVRKRSDRNGDWRFIQINANRTIEEVGGEILDKFEHEDD